MVWGEYDGLVGVLWFGGSMMEIVQWRSLGNDRLLFSLDLSLMPAVHVGWGARPDFRLLAGTAGVIRQPNLNRTKLGKVR